MSTPSDPPVIAWTENDQACSARWHSQNGLPPPRRVVVADDRMAADTAYRLACEGTSLLWRGDFQNARLLLQALTRRVDQKSAKAPAKAAARKAKADAPPPRLADTFHLHRQAQAQRARTLGMLLLPFDADHGIPLRRAPDVREACNEACGAANGPYVASLRELQGMIGAHEWRRNGIEIAALGARIHPHYGVFAPVRSEYIDLAAAAPLPAPPVKLAFDIGTGTGVLAALLAKRGVRHVVATDQDPRALACARDNIARLNLGAKIKVVEADLFPAGRAALVVCNPPWLPTRPSSKLEQAVYDPDSRMLRGFLGGLAAHLEPGGEGWLLLSDLAEHLGLRQPGEVAALIAAAGLKVVARHDIRPRHPRAADAGDPLHAARAAETTTLWRLAAA